MTLTDPKKIYSQILSEIDGRSCGHKEASEILSKLFLPVQTKLKII